MIENLDSQVQYESDYASYNSIISSPNICHSHKIMSNVLIIVLRYLK